MIDPALTPPATVRACVIIECPDISFIETLKSVATHIEAMSLPGSDPHLCLAAEDDPVLPSLHFFGLPCTARIVNQHDALHAAGRAHLSGYRSINDGVIGAAAAIGLIAGGWSGRFIEYANLRAFPDGIVVSELLQKGIRVVSLDRHR